jgi:hypothetical protein
MQLQDNGTDVLVVKDGGNVGIGITDPQHHGQSGALHLADNYEIGFGNGANGRPDFGIAGNGSSLSFFCGEGSDTVDLSISTDGHVSPGTDATQNLGSATKRWNNIYTTDLHLANDRGNWTVIEEENYLTLRNNKTDKVYKLVMEEIE